jgi:malate dehydrogenase (oxaloacetate-decarboxylating)(NADP+)
MSHHNTLRMPVPTRMQYIPRAAVDGKQFGQMIPKISQSAASKSYMSMSSQPANRMPQSAQIPTSTARINLDYSVQSTAKVNIKSGNPYQPLSSIFRGPPVVAQMQSNSVPSNHISQSQISSDVIKAQAAAKREELKREALHYHAMNKPGKYTITATKPMETAKDLTLAYSPGVAEPCLEIKNDPSLAYKYTTKGNMVAVITNGTAVLGLGNIGALAAKPVMEGKSVLLQKFGGVDSIDLCVDAQDPDEFIQSVKNLSPSFAGVNLEDIKGPDCFYIEEKLKELMNIPVFHDDQHGTAIVCLAGLINALEIQGKNIGDVKIVVNGAGAAGIACLKLIRDFGADPNKCFLVDTKGVIYKGRTEGMNSVKELYATETDARTLEEITKGTDVLIGVSSAGIFTEEIVKGLAEKPIIFAMANPEPEIRPELAKSFREDVIIATGRSDYPNQVNNVMCFPFLFRAALDVRASQINEQMKYAAAMCLSKIVKNECPEVSKKFGPDYIIPSPFDERIMWEMPVAIAKAACESGVAQAPITDFEGYRTELILDAKKRKM